MKGDHAATGFVITRQLRLEGDLDAEQRQRLLEIADKCPVHKTLSGAIQIQTVAL
jgi:putative redox protein